MGVGGGIQEGIKEKHALGRCDTAGTANVLAIFL